MKNYLNKGDTLDVTLTGAVTGGVAALVGAECFGVPMTDGVAGAVVAFVREGVFSDQPTDTGAAWTFGDALYWDNTNHVFTKTATNNLRVGFAGAAKASGDTTATVVIDRRVG
ncbi:MULTISPECIES: DUF2190 family protein [unclassified Bradyrhizobium]|uniref:DUF2190 family protein n=1 Tax=unclassified Bradyrhizobium TaxID=2631580 RepID=UPI0028F1350D|nr:MULTISPECIES: DUF2190 family protein [unclassified Bradyrhizobium]